MRSPSKKPKGLGRYGEPATLILISLAGEPRHGYAIMSDIEARMGVAIGPGTLYAAISRLLDLGLIRPVPTEERARPYEITADGLRSVAEFVRTWSPIVRIGEASLT